MFEPLTPQEWSAIELSLRVATVASLASLPFGIAVAWLLARGRFVGRALLDGIVHLPLVMPPVVTGYLLLLAFGTKGPIGAFLQRSFGIVLAFNWTGAALAAAIMGFPLMVRAIRLSIEAIDPRLERRCGDARCPPDRHPHHRDAAAGAARHPCRHGPLLRAGAR